MYIVHSLLQQHSKTLIYVCFNRVSYVFSSFTRSYTKFVSLIFLLFIEFLKKEKMVLLHNFIHLFLLSLYSIYTVLFGDTTKKIVINSSWWFCTNKSIVEMIIADKCTKKWAFVVQNHVAINLNLLQILEHEKKNNEKLLFPCLATSAHTFIIPSTEWAKLIRNKIICLLYWAFTTIS